MANSAAERLLEPSHAHFSNSLIGRSDESALGLTRPRNLPESALRQAMAVIPGSGPHSSQCVAPVYGTGYACMGAPHGERRQFHLLAAAERSAGMHSDEYQIGRIPLMAGLAMHACIPYGRRLARLSASLDFSGWPVGSGEDSGRGHIVQASDGHADMHHSLRSCTHILLAQASRVVQLGISPA